LSFNKFFLLYPFLVFSKALSQSEIYKKWDSKKIDYSVLFYDLSKQKIIENEKSENRLIPASLTKLYTATKALQELGPDYNFKHQLWTNGKISNRTLKGNIYYKGLGDPYFTQEKIWVLLSQLNQYSLKKIEGKWIFDASLFTPSSQKGSGNYAYDGPISPIAVNFSTEEVIRVQNTRVKKSYLSVADPNAYTSQVFVKTLKSLGIQFQGKFELQNFSLPQKQLLAEEESFPLYLSIRAMLQRSNNFIADMLAARFPDVFLTKDLNSIIQRTDALPTIYGGSGLRIENRISALDINELLKKAYLSPKIFPHVVSSLAQPSHIGSLKTRNLNSIESLKSNNFEVYGKTGTLTTPKCVIGLAGYVLKNPGNWYSFAILLNGPSSLSPLDLRSEVDKVFMDIMKKELSL